MAGFRFPSWLTQNNNAELESTYADLPKAYDTSAVEQNFGQQQDMNTSRGLRMSEAMQRAASGRAARGGGQVAASFAAGGAMLPIYAQNAAMAGQSAQMRLQAAMAQAQARASIASNLSGSRQNQQQMMAGFYGDTMNRNQQESQFSRNLAQQGSQFDRNLMQDESQFGRNLAYQNKALGQNESQFSRQFGLQNTNSQFERAMQALQLMPRGPMYTTGPNATSADLKAQNIAMSNQMQRRAIQQRLQNLIF